MCWLEKRRAAAGETGDKGWVDGSRAPLLAFTCGAEHVQSTGKNRRARWQQDEEATDTQEFPLRPHLHTLWRLVYCFSSCIRRHSLLAHASRTAGRLYRDYRPRSDSHQSKVPTTRCGIEARGRNFHGNTVQCEGLQADSPIASRRSEAARPAVRVLRGSRALTKVDRAGAASLIALLPLSLDSKTLPSSPSLKEGATRSLPSSWSTAGNKILLLTVSRLRIPNTTARHDPARGRRALAALKRLGNSIRLLHASRFSTSRSMELITAVALFKG